jgi:hypothetical protein
MAFSIKQMRAQLWGFVALGSVLACGSQESVAPIDSASTRDAQPVPEREAELPANVSGNAPPTIERLVLKPEFPKEGERVEAIVEASDPENDLIRFSFAWTVDGRRIDHSASDFLLEDVPKGTWVKVLVVARDLTGASPPREESVTVANQPPQLREIVFDPQEDVSSENDITAYPRAFDVDGDEVTYRYLWTINGLRDNTNVSVLSASRFKRGDEIVLELIANDGDDDSEPLISDPISIVNASPRIVSTPSGFGGQAFRYQLRVDDPDGDRALRFRLIEGPNGMTIDDISGKISWVPKVDQEGAHPVAVAVRDSQGGEDTQRFDLSLGFEGGQVPAALER